MVGVVGSLAYLCRRGTFPWDLISMDDSKEVDQEEPTAVRDLWIEFGHLHGEDSSNDRLNEWQDGPVWQEGAIVCMRIRRSDEIWIRGVKERL
jgi:hypothetical protein